MIPLLWRYLLKNYLKVFFLSIFAFICILLLMRVQEIARFITFGASKTTIALFILLQFPLILPLAIPISSLIASTLLVDKLNTYHELTSLRSQGLSIKEILYPLKLISLFLALLNFAIASELTPTTRLKGRNLMYEATAHNPFALIRANKVAKLKDCYAELNMSSDSKKAKDIIVGFINPKSERINLIIADEMSVEDKENLLLGKNVAFISSLNSKNEDSFDHLVIENYGKIENSSSMIVSLLQESQMRRISNQKLRIKPLVIRTFIAPSLKEKKGCILEILRRCSLSLATYSFTMLGSVFSLHIGRQRNKKALFKIALTTLFFFISYLIAKSSSHLWLGILFFALPHLFIYVATTRHKTRVNLGIER